MIKVEDVKYIRSRLNDEDIYYQLAEEAAELSEAALKMARVLRGKNPTPVTEQEAFLGLLSEYADVEVCIAALNWKIKDLNAVTTMKTYKSSRWVKRLQEKERESHDD